MSDQIIDEKMDDHKMEEDETPAVANTEEEKPLKNLEESLLSHDKLDRASPEMWPDTNNDFKFLVPGVSHLPITPAQKKNNQPSWGKKLSWEDIIAIKELSTLSTSRLIFEVKRLHNLAYQMGVVEAREMTRAKYLDIYGNLHKPLRKRPKFDHSTPITSTPITSSPITSSPITSNPITRTTIINNPMKSAPITSATVKETKEAE